PALVFPLRHYRQAPRRGGIGRRRALLPDRGPTSSRDPTGRNNTRAVSAIVIGRRRHLRAHPIRLPAKANDTTSGGIPTATNHIAIPGSDLEVSVPLHELVVNEILPDLGMEARTFWALLEDVITEMAPKNNILLLKRYQLQAQINTWHQARSDKPHDPAAYK